MDFRSAPLRNSRDINGRAMELTEFISAEEMSGAKWFGRMGNLSADTLPFQRGFLRICRAYSPCNFANEDVTAETRSDANF